MARGPFALDLDHLLELLPRYDRPAPRYTSYPTAPVWGEDYGPAEFRADLGREDVEPGSGLCIYVHVPFCRALCHFCACNRVITRDVEQPVRYLATLQREVAAVAEAVSARRPVTQCHWGGGTPTHLTPDQIVELHHVVTDAFPLAAGAEVSIEVDPRVTHADHVDALRECGFNRMSMGVQDFDEQVQAAIHRVQSVADTQALVERARSAGFTSVSFDLIYGLPHQTEASFRSTLESVLAIAPDRLALYSYAHVPWVAKQQRGFERHDLPSAQTKLRIMLLAIRTLLEAGYVFIGLDHFARPDDELAVALRSGTLRRNFMGHTTQSGVELVGFGPSAISELTGSYAQSHRDLGAWHDAVATDGVATMRGYRLTADDHERRWLISHLICQGEVRAEEYGATFGRDLRVAYRTELGRLEVAVEDGLVTCDDDGSLQVTPLGRLLVRNLAMVFDAHLPSETREAPLYSRSV